MFNDSDKSYIERLVDSLICESAVRINILEGRNYPSGSGVSSSATEWSGEMQQFNYLGDTNTTVEANLWTDAQVSRLVRDSNTVDLTAFVGKLANGYAALPVWLQDMVDSMSGDIWGGVNVKEKVAWLYDAESGVHYFFEVSFS